VQAPLQELYTDRHGESWHVPVITIVTDVVNWFIKLIPRFSKKFQLVDPDFDLENQFYLDSSIMYIVLTGILGLVFLLVIALFFLCRYVFKCCGGKELPRKGYTQSSIACVRISLVIFSFFLEGVLLYGYFANSDFDRALGKLVDTFKGIGPKLEQEMNVIIAALPNVSGQVIYDTPGYADIFRQDLAFSSRAAVSQSKLTEDLVGRFEGVRMALILLNLIIATVSCSVGVAAGSLFKGLPVIIMIIMNGVAGCLIFFSAGAHFAGAKMVFEFCDDIAFYLDAGADELLPMRLQFFVPCLSSPVFPFLQDYFVIGSVRRCESLTDTLRETNVWDNELMYSVPRWFNVSSPWYAQKIENISDNALKQEARQKLGDAVSFARVWQLVDDNRQCRFSREEMRGERFLFCTYMRISLDMLTLTQIVGAILLVIITCIGIPAVKKFEYAGFVGFEGRFNAGNQAPQRSPKAKRKK
jgi:hypothetical protein